MITYKTPTDEIVSISSVQELCQKIYGEEIDLMDANDSMAYSKIYEMLSQEEIIFFNYSSLDDLGMSVGVSGTDYSKHFSLRYERNVFVLCFLIRTFITKRNKTYSLNDDVIFVSINYNQGVYEVVVGALAYSEYPQLKPWIRKVTIDKLLKEI